MTIRHELHDWQPDTDPEPASYKILTTAVEINVNFNDGTRIWIEKEDGKIRVHCYTRNLEKEGPTTIDIHPNECRLSSS